MNSIHSFTSKSIGRRNAIYIDFWIRIPNTNSRQQVRGVWDTGATSSVITSDVAQALGLVATGKTKVNASGHTAIRSTYIIDMELPNNPDNVIISGLAVTDTSELGGLDVLIGMDVIGMGDFSITHHNGNTCMSFRIPSLHEIDYTENIKLTVKPPKKDMQRILSIGEKKRNAMKGNNKKHRR